MTGSAPNGEPRSGKFRRRTTVVEARQLTQENVRELIEWAGGKYWSRPPMRAVMGISFPHPVADGDQIAEFGDWVVQLGDGNFRVWNDDRFQEAYEAVVERDPAAELAEALKDMLNLDWEQYILSDRVPERREAANEVVESAEAALSAYEASK